MLQQSNMYSKSLLSISKDNKSYLFITFFYVEQNEKTRTMGFPPGIAMKLTSAVSILFDLWLQPHT